MNINEVKELIELINSSDLAYFEINNNGTTIKMDKSMNRSVQESVNVEYENNKQEINNVVENKVDTEIIKEKCDDGEVIKSPMVGSFYSKPGPDKDSFVNVGDRVSKGKVLCIIEAMKLMNEIEAEFDGEIIKILVNDGDMVEYGQPLFMIRRG